MKRRVGVHTRGSDLSYLARADKLRAAGFHVSLRKRKQTPQQKSTVTRLFKQHAHFLNPRPDTPPVKFFKTTPAQRRIAARTLSSRSLTPGGFFIQVPRGVKPSSYHVRIEKGSVIERIRGRQDDRIIPLNHRDVARDAVKAFRLAVDREERRTGRKPRQTQLIVNGFQGKAVLSLKEMLNYLEHSKRFASDTDELDPEDFEDTFQLKLIYGGKRKKRKTVRRRRR